ncbi:hypothetical protein CTEN210_07707 [Chaetoceros tenuissimus]|uniref:Uncharacterized protein n=1 Tax=Chaetoceros tenuissimus TaxID=426638 RepID=A0AAD3CU70_9STRA|nr:hypothetical protein CTEN210_07707 [Chaetoceros tenuissimus]
MKTTTKFPNSTPLTSMLPPNKNDSKDESFISVMSFNVLAPLYVRPFDKRTGGIQKFAAFDWISDEDTPNILEMNPEGLDNTRNGRAQRLLECLQSCHADVICLQELQLERNDEGKFIPPKWIWPILREQNISKRDFGEEISNPCFLYEYHLPPQDQLEMIAGRNVRVLGVDAAVTCAILYRGDRFQSCSSADKPKDLGMESNTIVALHLQGKSNLTEMIPPFVVSSVHLDAMSEEKRIGKLYRCLKIAKAMTSTIGADGRSIPQSYNIIIAGDMNQEFKRGSAVGGFIQDDGDMSPTEDEFMTQCADSNRIAKESASKQQMQKWKQMHKEAQEYIYDNCISLARLQTECTRSAYDLDEGSEVNRQMAQWRLDHILYSTHSLTPVAQWSTLEDDPISCSIGLPNEKCGSDHIPIAAVFGIKAPYSLTDKDRQKVIDTIQTLCIQQNSEMDKLECDLTKELEQIEATCKSISSDRDNSEPEKKKGKKSKKPPKEVIQFMRKKRSKVKELKATQKIQRKDLVQRFSDLERMLIDQELGCNASTFIESGSKSLSI